MTRRNVIKLSAITAILLFTNGCGGGSSSLIEDTTLSNSDINLYSGTMSTSNYISLSVPEQNVSTTTARAVTNSFSPMNNYLVPYDITMIKISFTDTYANILKNNDQLNIWLDEWENDTSRVKIKEMEHVYTTGDNSVIFENLELKANTKYRLLVTNEHHIDFITTDRAVGEISTDVERTRIVFISDLHINEMANDFWFNSTCSTNLTNFLDEVANDKSIKELVILGDLFDTWLRPRDSKDDPTNFDSIINNPDNTISTPVIQSLRTIANDTDIKVVYVSGNHDMLLTKEIIYEISTNIDFREYKSGVGTYYLNDDSSTSDVVAEHGHVYDFFNAPIQDSLNQADLWSGSILPSGKILPPGYFVTRNVASNKGSSSAEDIVFETVSLSGTAKILDEIFGELLPLEWLQETTFVSKVIDKVYDNFKSEIKSKYSFTYCSSYHWWGGCAKHTTVTVSDRMIREVFNKIFDWNFTALENEEELLSGDLLGQSLAEEACKLLFNDNFCAVIFDGVDAIVSIVKEWLISIKHKIAPALEVLGEIVFDCLNIPPISSIEYYLAQFGLNVELARVYEKIKWNEDKGIFEWIDLSINVLRVLGKYIFQNIYIANASGAYFWNNNFNLPNHYALAADNWLFIKHDNGINRLDDWTITHALAPGVAGTPVDIGLITYYADLEYAAQNQRMAEGFNIVLMGHTHVPMIKKLGSGIFVNTGTWVKRDIAGGEEKTYTYAIVDPSNNYTNKRDWHRVSLFQYTEKKVLGQGVISTNRT